MNVTVNPGGPGNPYPSAPATTMAPPPRRRGLKIFAVLVTLLLIVSALGNVILLLAMVFFGASLGVNAGPASRVVSETIRSGSSDKIAVLPVEGEVDDAMTQRLEAFCEYVKDDASIRGVILSVDSPGGTITASDEIHHLFTDLKATNRKLVVSMRSLAASGGYYLSMPAEKIYAEPTTLTGSIGVIWPAFEITGLMKDIGVKPEIIKSDSSSQYKDAGSPLKEFTDTDRAYIRGLVNNAQEKFSKVVEEGRKGKLTQPINQLANGKIYTADDALKLGLIDEIAYPDQVYDKTASDLGLSNPTIIRLGIRTGLLEAIGVKASDLQPKVELKLDGDSLKGLAPRMEYRAQWVQ